MKRLFKLIFRLVFAAALLGAAFVVGMRKKNPTVQGFARRMAKDVVNPETMKTAGQPGAPASIIRHRGRKTGTWYETPVTVVPADDGFVIPLPFGTSDDWFKNVMAAGTADIVREGKPYGVDHPELIPASVAEQYLPEDEQKMLEFLGVDDFLRVHQAEATSVDEEAGSPV